MPEVGQTACRRCRQQKVSRSSTTTTIMQQSITFPQLRCSRELPICARCLRLNGVCDYPPPPDRKTLAAFRATPRKRNRIETNVETSTHEGQESPSLGDSPHLYKSTADETCSETYDQFGAQLSEVVHELLQDTYFTCMFNSTLVFHRPSFRNAFQKKQLAHHVLLSVYATATMSVFPS